MKCEEHIFFDQCGGSSFKMAGIDIFTSDVSHETIKLKIQKKNQGNYLMSF
jgi:hypothetical protein